MKLIITMSVFLAMVGGVVYYAFFYPPTVLRNQVNDALESLAETVSNNQKTEITAALTELLSPDAQVHFDIHFFTIVETPGTAITRTDDTPSFIAFTDSLMQRTSAYFMTADVIDFQLAEDRGSAIVRFAVNASADGQSVYATVPIAVRYNAQHECEAMVMFADASLQVQRVQCAVKLRTVPKPGETNKIARDPEMIRQMLR